MDVGEVFHGVFSFQCSRTSVYAAVFRMDAYCLRKV
jgi:hypothetical protein